MPTIPQRIASAFAVLCGQYGDVTEMAKGRAQSRPSLFREAEQVAHAVDGTAGQLSYDLAIDASGAGMPSAIDAGLAMPGTPMVLGGPDLGRLLLALGFAALGLFGIGLIARARPSSRLAG